MGDLKDMDPLHVDVGRPIAERRISLDEGGLYVLCPKTRHRAEIGTCVACAHYRGLTRDPHIARRICCGLPWTPVQPVARAS